MYVYTSTVVSALRELSNEGCGRDKIKHEATALSMSKHCLF